MTDYINRNAEGALDIQAGYCIRFQQSDAEMLHSLIELIVREVSEKKMMSGYLLNYYVKCHCACCKKSFHIGPGA